MSNLLFFSQECFRNVRTKWHSEINHISSGTPIIVVGTKTDLRPSIPKRKISLPINRKTNQDNKKKMSTNKSNENENGIDSSTLIIQTHKKDIKSETKKLRNVEKYIECSSKTGENVDKVFEEAVMAVFKQRQIIDKNKKDNLKCRLCF